MKTFTFISPESEVKKIMLELLITHAAHTFVETEKAYNNRIKKLRYIVSSFIRLRKTGEVE